MREKSINPNTDGFVRSPIFMSFRAKREIWKLEHAERKRFLPAVEMTDSLHWTFYETVNYSLMKWHLERISHKPHAQGLRTTNDEDVDHFQIKASIIGIGIAFGVENRMTAKTTAIATPIPMCFSQTEQGKRSYRINKIDGIHKTLIM